MVELKSVRRPAPSALESASAAAPRRTSQGAAGSAAAGGSVSAEMLLVRGKGDPIPRPVPAASGNALESIIGTDDRTRILDTVADPWRMICALRISSQGGTFVGTGWLAGPQTLITAGHCVNHVQMGGWADSIEVSPARNGSNQPVDPIATSNYSTVDVWINERDPDFDIGAIHLDQPIGTELGWFGVGALPPNELTDYMVNISGYPADRGNGTEQWFHRNRVLRVSDRRVFYDVDTFGGHSGAPVWIYEPEKSDPLVVAIHAYGIGGTPVSFGITANSGPRIIPEVFDQIAAWVAQDTPADEEDDEVDDDYKKK